MDTVLLLTPLVWMLVVLGWLAFDHWLYAATGLLVGITLALMAVTPWSFVATWALLGAAALLGGWTVRQVAGQAKSPAPPGIRNAARRAS